jgi:gas vesicle protein
MSSGSRLGASVKGFLIGGALGSVVTFLFTPKSGQELRDEIESDAKEYYDKAKVSGKKIAIDSKTILNDIISKAEQLRILMKKYAEEAYTIPAQRIENEIKRLRHALNAAVKAYNLTTNRTPETDKKVNEIFSEFEDESIPKFEGMGRRNYKQ